MTPYEQNYQVPGRFEEHECTFITWPCSSSDLEIANFEKETVLFAQKLSQFETDDHRKQNTNANA